MYNPLEELPTVGRMPGELISTEPGKAAGFLAVMLGAWLIWSAVKRAR